MGSGEGDVHYLKVSNSRDTNPIKPSTTLGNIAVDTYWTNNTTGYYIYPQRIYLYQIKCPNRGCKKMNWLELDKITPCVGCKAKLKAVSDQPDYVVPVQK